MGTMPAAALTVSVLIPAYNEEHTVERILQRVTDVTLDGGCAKEIIVVNDCSTDQTEARVKAFQATNPAVAVRYFRHEVNRGKGAAIHTAIREAAGDYLIVQDADLEYDPAEFNILLGPVLAGVADVVYGSRFMGGRPHRILFFWHSIGNNILTLLSNMCNNLNLTDMETCYKLIRTDLVKGMTLREQRFGFEPEVTARLARIPAIRFYEVGISYYGRTYSEGKKINWRDGLRAIFCIFRYGLFRS